jgi:predicted transcriptional regulator of viral defense system
LFVSRQACISQVKVQTVSRFYEIQLALPPAVLCLASALIHYNLTTFEPSVVHVAIPRDERVLPPEFPPTRRFSFGKTRYNLSIVDERIERHDIRMYDREKIICDAVRYRRVLGQDVINEAGRDYPEAEGTNVHRLIEYSHILRVEGPVKMQPRLMT